MGRLACISVARLPLQLALRRFPEGKTLPLAVVREDKPTSPLIHVNRAAAEAGLRPGLRYSEALAIVADLRGTTVSDVDLQAAQNEILDVLAGFSPTLEVCAGDHGSFWADAQGLTSLYGSEAQWGSAVRAALGRVGYHAVVVIGSTRGGTLVLARSRRKSTVLGSLQTEQRALAQAPLGEVPLEPRHRRQLEKLGLRRFGELAALPPDELARRFGKALVRDLQAFQALTLVPLQAVHRDPVALRTCQLEAPESNRTRLLPVVRDLLQPVLAELHRKGHLLAELRLEFTLETWASSTTPARLVEVLRPASPTADTKVWGKLVELRLSAGAFPAAVVEVGLGFEEVDPPPGSGELFAAVTTRDLRRGAEALALIRAQWGNASVVHPVLIDSHQPEASFLWQQGQSLAAPTMANRPAELKSEGQNAVRRVFQPAAKRPGPSAGNRVAGPYRLQQPARGNTVTVDQEYWYLRTRAQEVQWVRFDRETQRPELTGLVD